ncbi:MULTISPECIES: preprotein translocase subunit YajC [unclassified Rhodococcus (in: high G+C Gram-positive bacteria)]|uniref:preprotein translocase subunit YajC n=1 Tax=unclassified Rhodococcus (in: high G+C Gram-positive bacteria) TaxID=192944 RepID=UPI00163992D8|nr:MULTISPECIES: preprotein translocase subunit YajC [unclassified Rhodococcus (in: high G+C Gram-positive bacteria)]MBC2643992.1 preprotein translocase subunit YajC [Rhodococcus sp. 3A]MBC2891269.1 preprotein translocase subunit YajC [Rhodococcus sp. 4CII]
MDFLFPLLILALLVPMFLGIRRQKKEAAKATALQDSLSVGDRILTTAGLHGTVVGLGDETIELEIAPGVVTTWSRLVVREQIVDAPLRGDGAIDHESIDAETSAADTAREDRESGADTTPRLDKD